MAIANPKSLHKLLDAVVDIGSGLELPPMLQRITDLAAELVDARYAALGVLDETGSALGEFITFGMGHTASEQIGSLPTGQGILGLLISDARPIRLANLHDHPASFGFPPGHPPMTSFLGVPIRAGNQNFGNLYLTEKIGGQQFDDSDEELIVGLAAAAGVAIDNARMHSRMAGLLLLEERERIARDLHDHVIQRLFATGMLLESTAPLLPAKSDALRDRLSTAVEDLDETIRQIRSVIMSLEEPRSADLGTAIALRRLCMEAADSLGVDPVIDVLGDLDAVRGELAADLLATLREALSNTARHADADAVQIIVAVDDESIDLQVIDDGVGPSRDPSSSGRGLANMAARAQRHGGSCVIGPSEAGGTLLQWFAQRR